MFRDEDTGQIQDCVTYCQECEAACSKLSDYLATFDAGPESASRKQRLADCASICQAASGFLLRGSPYAGQAVEMCADICEACAEECLPLSADPIVARWIALSRDCETACRAMESVAA